MCPVHVCACICLCAVRVFMCMCAQVCLWCVQRVIHEVCICNPLQMSLCVHVWEAEVGEVVGGLGAAGSLEAELTPLRRASERAWLPARAMLAGVRHPAARRPAQQHRRGGLPWPFPSPAFCSVCACGPLLGRTSQPGTVQGKGPRSSVTSFLLAC